MAEQPKTQNQGTQVRKQYRKDFRIYKPRKAGGGAASSWQLNKTSDAMYLEMAAQVGTMDGQDNAQFDWDHKLVMKLGIADIGELIAVLERRQPGIGPLSEGKHKGLFHKNQSGSASLAFEVGQQGGWFVKIGVQKTGEKVVSVQHSISHGEGAVLLTLLRLAVERIYGW